MSASAPAPSCSRALLLSPSSWMPLTSQPAASSQTWDMIVYLLQGLKLAKCSTSHPGLLLAPIQGLLLLLWKFKCPTKGTNRGQAPKDEFTKRRGEGKKLPFNLLVALHFCRPHIFVSARLLSIQDVNTIFAPHEQSTQFDIACSVCICCKCKRAFISEDCRRPSVK